MAFALRCIESECNRLCVFDDELVEILDLLWLFVESKQLGEWEDKTRGCDSLMALVDEIDGMAPRTGQAAWPEHLRRMVYDAYELGYDELYGGISGVSEGTLALALKTARLTVDAGGSVPTFDDLPTLSPFIGSIVVGLLAPDAWGPARPRRDFGAGQLGGSYWLWRGGGDER